MQRDAEENAKADEERIALIEATNKLDNEIYQLKDG